MTNSRTRLASCLSLPVVTLGGCGRSGSSQSGGLTSTFQSTEGFSFPYGVAVDSTFNLHLADAGINEVRLITPAGAATTLDGISAGLAQPTAPP
jgi:hypothetical protein